MLSPCQQRIKFGTTKSRETLAERDSPAGVLYRTQASAGKARTGPAMPALKASRAAQLFHLFPIKPELSSF
jgi:hypothetical protein